tara:strand:+ start:1067 stop:2686 length:1620 start_codon:yes stop_codon:yes gene_type:complete
MKYINIKRYKFSTISKGLNSLLDAALKYINFQRIKKSYNYLINKKNNLRNFYLYFNLRNYNIASILRKIKFRSNKFLVYHFPLFIIFFGFLYLLIPTFYNYDKSNIQNIICKNIKVNCIIRGKVSYSFFPTPRLKIKDLEINLVSKNKIQLAKVNDASLKLSYKNLLAKEKHKIKKVEIKNFKSDINLNDIKNYTKIFKKKTNYIPINFKKGEIQLKDDKNYIAAIKEAGLTLNVLEDSKKIKLIGRFLDSEINLNFNEEIVDNKPTADIIIKIQDINFLSKIKFVNSANYIKNGKFLLKQGKNKASGIFDYKDSEIKIIKSNVRNAFIDGKLLGNIVFLPFFDFKLDLDLNSINFTKLYNYFLSLDKEDQTKIFRINNKVNGKLNLSSEKLYTKNNLVKSFESRLKFYNGNLKIEQLLLNLGKLGAADMTGRLDNKEKSSNFKFESNIFVDNKKKFLSKFGIYNKEDLSSDLFVQGNFDLENIRVSLYEISAKEKFKTEDTNYIESEFNDLMLYNGYVDLFNFQKFKVFLKSARDDEN